VTRASHTVMPRVVCVGWSGVRRCPGRHPAGERHSRECRRDNGLMRAGIYGRAGYCGGLVFGGGADAVGLGCSLVVMANEAHSGLARASARSILQLARLAVLM
jgi:hypothetical protein